MSGIRVIALSLLFLQGCQSVRNHNAVEYFQVTSVIDGDTFRAVDSSGHNYKIRLIGIDAPESRKTGKKDIGYLGKESGIYLKELINGKRVKLVFDVQKYDQYKRILAYAYLEDGTFINAELIKSGFAAVMTIPPNVAHADEFIRLQRKARRQGKGIWQNTE